MYTDDDIQVMIYEGGWRSNHYWVIEEGGKRHKNIPIVTGLPVFLCLGGHPSMILFQIHQCITGRISTVEETEIEVVVVL